MWSRSASSCRRPSISPSRKPCRASRVPPPAHRSSPRHSRPDWSSTCRRSSTKATRCASTPKRANTSPGCEMDLANSPDHQLTNSRFRHAGWLEVVTGSMFSGKSEELIRRLRRAQIAKQKVQIFKPVIDNRYSEDHIVSHSDMRMASQNVRNSDELLKHVDDDTEVVGIDEGQFFDANLPAACTTLADRGKRVIVAGLDQDYLGRPFEPMPQLLAIAEYITKTLAISDRVLVGATGLYEARCRHCFDPTLAAPK